MNKKFVGYGLLLAALIVAPFFGAYPIFVMKLLCFALFASAFNLLLGYTRLLSFGHAAFFGGSAYVAGHAMKVWGFTPEMGLLVGTLTGAVLGWVFGVLAIRRQGIYFAMITLALAQMVFFLALQAPFTGGEDAIHAVPRGQLRDDAGGGGAHVVDMQFGLGQSGDERAQVAVGRAGVHRGEGHDHGGRRAAGVGAVDDDGAGDVLERAAALGDHGGSGGEIRHSL